MYDVQLVASARKVFERAPAALQQRLDRCFAQLAQDPRRHANIRVLRGELAGYWRYRIGDYRVVYRIDEEAQGVLVLVIAHRRDVYR